MWGVLYLILELLPWFAFIEVSMFANELSTSLSLGSSHYCSLIANSHAFERLAILPKFEETIWLSNLVMRSFFYYSFSFALSASVFAVMFLSFTLKFCTVRVVSDEITSTAASLIASSRVPKLFISYTLGVSAEVGSLLAAVTSLAVSVSFLAASRSC